MNHAVLDLFAGAAGGWSLGMSRAGYRTVAACEIDPWRRAVFAANHPGCRMYADVRELSADRLVRDLGYLPDIIVGSPPCQDISAANTAASGIDDDHLFWEWVRLVGEIRPVWCAAENSPRARTLGIDGVLDALAAGGYACWSNVVGADNAGANHLRKRLWLIAADADRLPLWEQPGWGGGQNGRCAAELGGDVANADCEGQHGFARDGEVAWGVDESAADASGARCDWRQDAGTDRGDEGESEGADWEGTWGVEPERAVCADATDADGDGWGLAGGRRLWSDVSGAEFDQQHAADADEAGHACGCMESGLRSAEESRHRCDDGQALPDALVAIGRAWPYWNGGLAGLAASCAAAGFGGVDDGLPAGIRNRAIAAYGDAVIPQIPEAVGRAMRAMMASRDAPQ